MDKLELKGNFDELLKEIEQLREKDHREDACRALAAIIGGFLVLAAFVFAAASRGNSRKIETPEEGFASLFVLILAGLMVAGYHWFSRRDRDGGRMELTGNLLKALRPLIGEDVRATLWVDYRNLERPEFLTDSASSGLNTGFTSSERQQTYRQGWLNLFLPFPGGVEMRLDAQETLLVTTTAQGKRRSSTKEEAERLLVSFQAAPGQPARGADRLEGIRARLAVQPHSEVESCRILEDRMELSFAEMMEQSRGKSPLVHWTEWLVDALRGTP